MKSLIIIRHAKSDWDNASLKDFDRPLNKRGKRDAPEMAKRLLEKKVAIDAFVSSTAVRAFITCKLIAQEYGIKEKDLILKPELYEASASVFYDVIHDIENKHNCIAIVAHNPAVTYLANQLSNTRIDNMPTCGVFAVRCNIDDWKNFSDEQNEFWFFDYPKNEF